MSSIRLYKHQADFLSKNPDKALLAWEGNTGKTLTGVEWLRSRQGNAIVVVPKRIKRKWQEALNDVRATVVTKEEWKKSSFEKPTALVIDECHHHNSPAFTRQRSQLTEKTYEFIRKNPDMPVLLLTATPISSNPANLHTLLCFIGIHIKWNDWRNEFYELVRMPYLTRPTWMPKKDWRVSIRKYLIKYAHIALMRDCIELPLISEETIKTYPQKKYVKPFDIEPSKAFSDEHRYEQSDKLKTIRYIGEQYSKVMISVFFRDQIDELYKELSKDRKTYVLHGGISDQESVAKQANEDDECYFICQAGCGEGFDSPTFNVLVFASMSYPFIHFQQMRWRITRGNELRPKRYIYLVGGRCDSAIISQLEKGKDFSPVYFMKNAA